MVICLEQGADLHMAQLMPLPLTVSLIASVKSRFVLTFWYRLTRVVQKKGPLNGCVCHIGMLFDHRVKIVRGIAFFYHLSLIHI